MYLKLYAQCIPVKGVRRGILCDLDHSTYFHMDNALLDILIACQSSPLDEVESTLSLDERQAFREFVGKIVEREYGFLTENPEWFPALDLTCDSPSLIQNAILEIDSNWYYDHVVDELNDLGCDFVELRAFDALTPTEIDRILELFGETRIRALYLVTPFTDAYAQQRIDMLLKRHPRIVQWLFHRAPSEKVERIRQVEVRLTTQEWKDHSCCGFIDPSYFSVRAETFSEALSFNTCLYGKISINRHGDILQCPSMSKTYGHVSDTALLDVIENRDFRQKWHLKKDDIRICRTCEFRYICTDCRAYVQDPADPNSKPLKCGYDPLSETWSDWMDNPHNKKAIAYYGLQAS